MPRILDNISAWLEEALNKSLRENTLSFDAAVGYFNLRGWNLIADQVEALPGREGTPKVRLLVGMTEDPRDEMRRLQRVRALPPMDMETAAKNAEKAFAEMRNQLEVGLPTEADEEALRRLRAQIDSGLVEVRLFLAHRLHAKLYLCHKNSVDNPRTGYVGSSNLTRAGLSDQGELNVDVTDHDSTAKLAEWFDEMWNHPLTLPADLRLVELLDESWASKRDLDPYLVYLKMAWHLSKEARDGLIEYGLPKSISNKLLDFQTAAVNIAARIVHQRGGVIVGDVVGLGKTLVATAIARLLQEEHGVDTLIVCPKNLVPMWESYADDYGIRGRVIPLSMLPRGALTDLRRYRLVIVDESHNLRNRKSKSWRALRDYISDNDSKVVLLSATPYNKDVSDIDAQMSLFLDDAVDLGVRPERAIAAAGEADFSLKCDGRTSSIAAFRLSGHHDDWQELLSQFMVRRTRRFIQDNYAFEDDRGRRYLQFGDGGRFYFPERIANPVERELSRDDPARKMIAPSTLEAVAGLRLPRYRIGEHLTGGAALDEAEQELIDDLRRSARGNLLGFTRVMLFKRLSSSGPAFLATLKRHALRNLVTAYAMENGLPVPIGSVDKSLWYTEADQETGDLFERGGLEDGGPLDGFDPAAAYHKLRRAGRGNVRWLRSELLEPRFSDDLDSDTAAVRGLLDRFGSWNPGRDGKLGQLMEIVAADHAADKVIVFTEYADTAFYIASELRRRGVDGVEAVTGSSDNPRALACRFSPVSNNVDPPEQELRVLISTDVLSEGQNLQDAHIVVNYDLPWAIVKLVQRAGRVDRIGQQSEQVRIYSLLPAGKIEEVIDLRGRIRTRLRDNAQLLGSDEKFFGDPSEQAMIAGLFDEHSEYQLEDGGDDVDPVSMAYEVWRSAAAEHSELAARVENLPDVVYSSLDNAADNRPTAGVLVHSKTVTGSDAFAFVPTGGRGERITPQRALAMAACEPGESPPPRLPQHHDLVQAAFAGPLTAPPERPGETPTGVRGLVWNRLEPLRDTLSDNLLFSREDLEAALNDLAAHPLQSPAAERLSKARRQRSNEDLAALLVNLHQDGQLCEYPDTSDQEGRPEPRVICSMGFTSTPA